jgi:hypothetical protein
MKKITLKSFLKNVYNFNPTNKCTNKWDNLQSKLEESTQIHEIDRWENLSQNNMIIFANNLHTKTLNINANKIEQYDLAYENDSCIKPPNRPLPTKYYNTNL